MSTCLLEHQVKHTCQIFRKFVRDKSHTHIDRSFNQSQYELCGSYHLLQFCFSFFVCLHGQLELFRILQFCSSFFLQGQIELLASEHFLQSWVSLQFIVVTSLQFERGQALFIVFFSVSDDIFFPSCVFGSSSCSIIFVSNPQPFFHLFLSL